MGPRSPEPDRRFSGRNVIPLPSRRPSLRAVELNGHVRGGIHEVHFHPAPPVEGNGKLDIQAIVMGCLRDARGAGNHGMPRASQLRSGKSCYTVAMTTSFPELGLRAELVAALARMGITEPMPIQAAAWPALTAGKNAYLNSETGTGKTLAYLLPLFSAIDTAADATQVAILAPTHELAIQIQRQCTDLAQHAGMRMRIVLLIGGTSLDRQIEKLKKKPHLVVGSPGRIADLIRMGKLKTHRLKSVVVDEADRLLVGEGLPAIRQILKTTPSGRQLVFVSATEQPEANEALASIAPGLVMLRAGATAVNPNIEHLYVLCEEREKPDLLRSLLHAMKPARAMVFTHRNDMAQKIAAKLAQHKVPAADLHAEHHKEIRKKAMENFRSGVVTVLIASDVGARGLDFKDVTHVFNLDAPTQSKAYLHRVGRAARAGAKGTAVSLLTKEEERLARRYEKELGVVMRRVSLREGRVHSAE